MDRDLIHNVVTEYIRKLSTGQAVERPEVVASRFGPLAKRMLRALVSAVRDFQKGD